MLPPKHFYMIRHGQTEANAARVMAGSTDSPLTPLGQRQARSVHMVLESLAIKPQTIIHSHLSRARDTAHILNESLDAHIYEDADLAEMHVGSFEGASYEDCAPIFEALNDPPGGETHADFCGRIRRGLTRALKNHDHSVLVVCHGGVLAALGKLYGIRAKHLFQNCHLYEFEPNPSQEKFPWQVWQHDPCHKENGKIIRKTAVLFHEAVEAIDS